jgi:tetratricopeptide (TPR) repeat protein
MAKFWTTMCWTTLLRLSFACLVMPTGTALAGPEGHTPSTAPTTAQRTAALINQLGDPQYAVRQQAQEELAKLGPEAFDVLVAAEENDDLEIAARARYLVHLIRIDWIHETDSPLVKEALTDYDSKNLRERRAVMLRLVEMPRSEALAPLCRLIRFEKSALVAKQGALAIMLQSEPAETAWPQQAKQILHALSGSDRAPARWLRNYVHSHDDPEAALADWDKLVTEELTVTDATDPQAETQLQNLLLRNYAQMLLARQHRDRAFDVMRKMIARESDDVDGLISFVDWLVEQKAWEVVDETARQFDRTFAADRTLLYAEAQSRKARGDEAGAEKYAEQAFKIVSTEPEDSTARFRVARRLYTLGMVAWSEKEYQRIIKDDPADSNEVLTSRTLLAEMLHDQERDGEAAEMLEKLVKQLSKNGELAQKMAEFELRPGLIRAQLHFYKACQAAAKNDLKRQTDELDEAIDKGDPADPDPDVLIALYHLPNQDAHRRKQTLELINRAIQSYEISLTGQSDSNRARNCYNEYAWLVANTEGNLDRALDYSQKAVEMSPGEGELLDTLAHCYAAKKDFENAVKYQTKAVEFDPGSSQIRRSLEEFRKARDEAKAKK